MTITGAVSLLPQMIIAKGPAKTKKTNEITQSIINSESIPTGYNGADGKVKIDPKSGTITFTDNAKGKDVGVFVEFMPVKVGNNKYLTVNIKGRVFQREGWAKYGSVQIIDKSGKRHILRELCQSVHADCTKDLVVDLSKGKNLKIKLPNGLKDIKRVEIVFVGKTKVFKGLTISDIGLSE